MRKCQATKRLAMALALLCAATMVSVGEAGAIPQFGSTMWVENCGRHIMAACFGERLKDDDQGQDYTIHTRIWDINGDPITTLAYNDLALSHDQLVDCGYGFSAADQGTDATGYSLWSVNPGRVHAGLVGDASDGVDCNEGTLYYGYALGIVLNDAQPVCVSSTSPDLNGDLTVTVADFGKYATDFNCVSGCDPCHDFDEDGTNGIADFAIFASYFNQCVCEE